MTELQLDRMESPLGALMLVWRGEALCALGFDDREDRLAATLKVRFGDVTLKQNRDSGLFRGPIEEYFAGDLRALDRIAVDTGGTSFQQSVWRLLRRIPPGQTDTYGDSPPP